MKVSQILDKIDENQLFVPAFQREYVWKRDDAKELIASLIKEYPTGTMLTWETNKPPELKGAWRYNENQGAVKLILDGQQRITTLYMLIRGEIPPYYKPEDITHDTRGLHVNVETMDLQYYKRSEMAGNPLWVNITDILQRRIRAKDVVRSLREKGEVSDELDDRVDDNFKAIERIPDQDFVEQTIPVKANIKEAIDIFYVVNASGVNLTDAELALAQISGYWPEARDLFKTKLRTMDQSGFVFKLDFLVYVMLGVLHHGGSDMRKLHTPDNLPRIKEAWKRLDEQVLDYVMNLMKTHGYVDHTKEINSVYALVPIVVYCYRMQGSSVPEGEIRKFIKWFYFSQIRQRYISQLGQKLDRDIGIVVNSKSPFDDLLNIIRAERPLELSADEFIGANSHNPLWSLTRWCFKSKNAVCLTTGVGIRQNMGKKYSLEWDHIFAYSILREAGYSQHNRVKYAMAQEIANRVVLTQLANRSKSDKLAEGYLAKVRENFPAALKLQSIPPDEELWKLDNFEKFLAERRRMLASELNEFLERITHTAETEVETSLEGMIAEGESVDLEFKGSLRWNYNASCVDKKMEEVVLKTIAAFSNSDGGTLLIGVMDEGDIVGLERDYTSLDGNKDEFEVHLRNLINKAFGVGFAAKNLHVSFPKVDDKEVCKIEIKKANDPQYITITDQGTKVERFYIRSGNTSIELPLKDVTPYIQGRFN
jgi:hypothetical protein